MAEEGEDLKEHLVHKYGPRAAHIVDDPNNHLMQSGREVGINFKNERKIYPTVKAHALMEHLKDSDQNDKANDLMEIMYKEYFENGQNINSVETLQQLAAQVGMEADQARSVMEDGALLRQVEEKDYHAKRQMGVSGVPFFIIESNQAGAKPVAFSGAQPPDVIAEVLEEAA